MPELPTISVVTPSYNQGRYLRQTIESVLSQDYPRLEYFVIDGGSTDNSVQIIEEYSGRLTSWVSERDHGQSHAINKGFARATGEIICWLNSDDYFAPGALRAVGTFAAEHPECELIYGHINVVDDEGAVSYTRKPNVKSYAEFLDVWWGVWRPGVVHIYQPESFWRRRVYDETGGLDEGLTYCMDWEYWLRALKGGAQVGQVHQVLANFRRHDAQKTSQSQRDKQKSFDRRVLHQELDSPNPHLPEFERRRLALSLLYDELLLPIILDNRESDLRTSERWWRVASIVARHPRLIWEPRFRQQVAHAFKRRTSLQVQS